MRFNEIFKRYQEGKASPEEKQYIEEELEKYEMIEDHFAEHLPDDFFDNKEETEQNTKETNHVKRVVNKRIRKIILTAVIAAAALYIGIFYGLSNLVDTFYYDPTEISQTGEADYERSDFHYDLKAYVSLNMPGYSAWTMSDAHSNGFGEYEIYYSLNNLFTGQDENHLINLTRNQLTFGMNGIFDHENRWNSLNGFETIYRPLPEDADLELIESIQVDNNETTIDYLENLNALSYVSMNVAFTEDLTMTELHELSEEFSTIEFKWIGVRTAEDGARQENEQPVSLIGFNPNFHDEPSTLHNLDQEEYPLFHLEDVYELPAMSEEEHIEIYETHFKSRLKYLSEQEEFINLFDSNPDKIEFYKDALHYVENNGVETYGVLIYGSPDELLEFTNAINYEALFLNDVSPVKPYIY